MSEEEREEIKKLKEEIHRLETEAREREEGIEETNKYIKILYNELENKNKDLQALDQLKSDFVSTVSHELRTPMTIVKEGIAQILDGIFGEINEGQTKILSMSLKNIDRLARIINNLLDISKFESGRVDLHLETVDIVALALEICDVFYYKAQEKGIKIIKNFSSKTIFAQVDRDMIIQVFTNLIGNAIKFTEEGEIKVSVIEKEENVECCVEDTGIGMEESVLCKVFDKFQQFGRTNGPGAKGTGLGLAICKNILELHYGSINVESTHGKGSKFVFVFSKKSKAIVIDSSGENTN